MNSISSLIKHISDNDRNYPNNIRQEIKNICNDCINDKISSLNVDNNNDYINQNNKSLYTDCLEEEIKKFDYLENKKKIEM